jgi:hypothetical protein
LETLTLHRDPLDAKPGALKTGSHGGSHGHLMNKFVTAILQDREPLVDILTALNLTVSGIVAHQSALKGGELLKIPQYHRGAAPGSLPEVSRPPSTPRGTPSGPRRNVVRNSSTTG